MIAAHFSPWQDGHRPCWHCTHFVAVVYQGSAAMCSAPSHPVIRSNPIQGCASFTRQSGADDVQDSGPASISNAALLALIAADKKVSGR
jgi:hypothetical protein